MMDESAAETARVDEVLEDVPAEAETVETPVDDAGEKIATPETDAEPTAEVEEATENPEEINEAIHAEAELLVPTDSVQESTDEFATVSIMPVILEEALQPDAQADAAILDTNALASGSGATPEATELAETANGSPTNGEPAEALDFALAVDDSELVSGPAELATKGESDIRENGTSLMENGEMTVASGAQKNDEDDEENTIGADKSEETGIESSDRHQEVSAGESTTAEISGADLEAVLAKSAENTASAYKSRTRRHSSISSVDSQGAESVSAIHSQSSVPSTNRLSLLYEDSSRRLCFDAAVVEKVRIFRGEGKIEVVMLTRTREVKMGSTDPLEGDRSSEVENAAGDPKKPFFLQGILVRRALNSGHR